MMKDTFKEEGQEPSLKEVVTNSQNILHMVSIQVYKYTQKVNQN